MTKHALPSMKKQNKGRIINISSAHGRIPDAYKSAYCAAKSGQIGFTKVVALENAQTESHVIRLCLVQYVQN